LGFHEIQLSPAIWVDVRQALLFQEQKIEESRRTRNKETEVPMNATWIQFLTIAAASVATAGAQDDPWAALRFLEGKWEGVAKASPERESARASTASISTAPHCPPATKSIWEPKIAAAKPEIHEDFGMYSYDKLQRKIGLRQFHAEGFVNE
jgi:hypothetical protein